MASQTPGGATTPIRTCLVLLSILLLHLATANPFGEHRCFNMTPSCTDDICKCSCERMDIPPVFEVNCPPQVGNVQLEFVPGSYFKIDCRTTNDELVHLPSMDVGPVESVGIKGCKMPASASLSSVTQRLGIRSMKALFLTNEDKDFPFRREHFKGLNLRRFSMNTRGLTELPDDFFAEIANITWLEIKNSKLQRVKNALAVLTELKTLEMNLNSISRWEEGAFETLQNLEKMSLWSNQLDAIGKEDFRGLARVKVLDLLGNRIKTIHPDAFLSLTNMTYIGLNKNSFKELPEGLFRANGKLEEAKFLYNNISALPSDLFANLPELKTISLSSSGIVTLPETVFANSSAITNISLNDNAISVLGRYTFRDLRNLLQLDLQSNRIVELPQDLLINCRQLRHLQLSYNELEHLPESFFQGQVNLVHLSMKNNRLKTISGRTFDFTNNIRFLDLSNNQINFPVSSLFNDVPQSPLQQLRSLEQLNLSNNSIQHVHSDFSRIMTQLKEINLSHNNISFVQYQHLQFHGNGIQVDLSHNQILDMDFSIFELITNQSSAPREAPIINLDENPFDCNCNILHFVYFLQRMSRFNVGAYLRINPQNLNCATPKRLEGARLRYVQPKELVCEFTETYSNQSCPEPCNCALRPHDLAVIVNCSSSNLRTVPDLPIATMLNYNNTILHIENNRIERLPTNGSVTGYRTTGYMEVQEIHARLNNITEIGPENVPENLQLLDLTNNSLKTISEATIKRLNKTNLRLSNNEWMCDCSMRDVLSFMQLNYQRITDYQNLYCVSGKEISTLTTSDICPQELRSIIILSTILSCLGILAGLLAALYYKYQTEVKIWMYWHNIMPFLFNSDVLDNDKKYDAFISYSHKDEDFVTDELVPELEQKRRFNLCIHRRDWTPGDFIPEQIVRSVADSRRTLIVLSPNYVESVWGTMEFRTAHRSAMEEQVARVIVVVFGKVDREALDPELKSYIDMNTYIEWGDPWFWERLHYALRTIQTKKKEEKKSDGNGLKKTPLKSSVDDKLELIHPSPMNSPLTTPPAEHPLNFKLNNSMNGHVNGAYIINTNSKQSDV